MGYAIFGQFLLINSFFFRILARNLHWISSLMDVSIGVYDSFNSLHSINIFAQPYLFASHVGFKKRTFTSDGLGCVAQLLFEGRDARIFL